jgi:hypothetical protein
MTEYEKLIKADLDHGYKLYETGKLQTISQEEMDKRMQATIAHLRKQPAKRQTKSISSKSQYATV